MAVAVRNTSKAQLSLVAVRAASSNAQADQLAKIGNRDIVGFGWNGEPMYMDRPDYPMPAIRFKENTPDVLVSLSLISYNNTSSFYNRFRLWERRRRETGRSFPSKKRKSSTVHRSVRPSSRWTTPPENGSSISELLWLPLLWPSTFHWWCRCSVSFGRLVPFQLFWQSEWISF